MKSRSAVPGPCSLVDYSRLADSPASHSKKAVTASVALTWPCKQDENQRRPRAILVLDQIAKTRLLFHSADKT